MIVNDYLAQPDPCELDRRATRATPTSPRPKIAGAGNEAYWRMRDALNGGNAKEGGNGGSSSSSTPGSSSLPEDEDGNGGNGNGNGESVVSAGERYRFEARVPVRPVCRVYRPRDLNLERVVFGSEAFIESIELDVEGYRHFQVCLETPQNSIPTINVFVAQGIFRLPQTGVQASPGGADFSSVGQSAFVQIGTIGPTATTRFHSLYFGSEFVITPGASGDTFRLGRSLVLQFENQVGPSTENFSAWLVCLT